MRLRTLLLFAIALLLAGGTAMLARSWLAQRPALAAAAPLPSPPARKSRFWSPAPRSRAGRSSSPPTSPGGPGPRRIQGRVHSRRERRGEIAGRLGCPPAFCRRRADRQDQDRRPRQRGFLAAVLRPGMRAVSVPVDATSGISGFVFPGDRVDMVITLPVPQRGRRRERLSAQGGRDGAARRARDRDRSAARQQGRRGGAGADRDPRSNAKAERDHRRSPAKWASCP